MEREQHHTRRRTATWAGAAVMAVMFMGSTLVTPLYVLYQRALGFSGITLTLIYAAYVIGNLCALFVFGRVSDQIGRKHAILPAIALAGASTLVFLAATSTAWLFVGRALSGLATGLAASAATAWIAELTERSDISRAPATAAGANFAGLAVGSLLAGVLAQYAPAPLQLSYVIYLGMLALLALWITRSRETVKSPRQLGRSSLSPRVGVPRGIRSRFAAPAAVAFAVFALGGFYAALAPTLLRDDLHEPSIAVGGAVVCELFAVAALAVRATRALPSRAAMLGGTALLVPSVALLVIAQWLHSLPLLLVGVGVTGMSFALGYRGTLQVIQQIAPDDKRAEVIASYQIACFLGNALPVVGIGIVSAAFGAVAATVSLAVVIAGLAVFAFVEELARGGGSVSARRRCRRG